MRAHVLSALLLVACSSQNEAVPPVTLSNGGSCAGVSSGGAPGAVSSGGGGAGGGSGTSGASEAGGSEAGRSGAGSGGSGGSAPEPEPQPPKASGILCVFDYDLTLSTNNCIREQYSCRTNTCLTYNWYQQCMSLGARRAIEVCVERGAYLGIASHANVDGCWNDKVAVIMSEQQFPALTSALRYGSSKTDFAYPKLDVRENWNCDDCAYHMNGGFSKPQLIGKVMKHFGMNPDSASDRARVIFWDDLPDNISKMKADMPEVHTVHVHENIDGEPNSGGCGILESDITEGWKSFPEP